MIDNNKEMLGFLTRILKQVEEVGKEGELQKQGHQNGHVVLYYAHLASRPYVEMQIYRGEALH